MSEWNWQRIETERLRAEMCAEVRFPGEEWRGFLDFVLNEDKRAQIIAGHRDDLRNENKVLTERIKVLTGGAE